MTNLLLVLSVVFATFTASAHQVHECELIINNLRQALNAGALTEADIARFLDRRMQNGTPLRPETYPGGILVTKVSTPGSLMIRAERVILREELAPASRGERAKANLNRYGKLFTNSELRAAAATAAAYILPTQVDLPSRLAQATPAELEKIEGLLRIYSELQDKLNPKLIAIIENLSKPQTAQSLRELSQQLLLESSTRGPHRSLEGWREIVIAPPFVEANNAGSLLTQELRRLRELIVKDEPFLSDKQIALIIDDLMMHLPEFTDKSLTEFVGEEMRELRYLVGQALEIVKERRKLQGTDF